MPTRLSADVPASQASAAAPAGDLLSQLLERLRRLTGVEFEWVAGPEAPASGRSGTEVRVNELTAGRLRTSAGSQALEEAAAGVLSEWLNHEDEIRRQASELGRQREGAGFARRLFDSLTPASDRQRLCEAILDEIVRIFQSRSATLRLRDSHGGELLSVAARAAGNPAESRAGEEQLELPIQRLRGSGEPEEMGSLRLSSRRDGARFTASDAELARVLAAQAGDLLHHCRLIEEARQGERRRREMEIARELHSALLPPEDPRLSGLEVAGACLPAAEIGGETFSYLLEEPGCPGFILLEVSGQGVGAVMASSGVRALLRSETARNESPAAALRSVNRLLARDLQPSGQFATAFIARCVDGGRSLRYSGAGHPAALLWRSGEGRFERLEAGGLALGIFEDAAYEQEEKHLEPGDLVVAFTDGLPEARNPGGEAFSVERICQTVMRHRRERPRTLLYRLLEAVEAFRSGHPQADDITAVVMRAVRSEQ
jgi:serine phosphatase RsbU (regulator of sigma subunit)